MLNPSARVLGNDGGVSKERVEHEESCLAVRPLLQAKDGE